MKYSGKNSPHRVNTYITSRIYLFLIRTFKLYSLSKFQLYEIVLSTVVTMLFVRFSNLIHLITESFYPFTTLSKFLPPPCSLAASFQLFYELEFLFFSFFFKFLHISDTTQYLFFPAWFISLCRVPFSYIHVFTNGRFFFS